MKNEDDHLPLFCIFSGDHPRSGALILAADQDDDASTWTNASAVAPINTEFAPGRDHG